MAPECGFGLLAQTSHSVPQEPFKYLYKDAYREAV